MPAIITTKTRVLLATQFMDSFTTLPSETALYLFVGKVTPWPNDTFPPVPQNTDLMFRNAWKDMIGGKKVSPADFSHVIRRVDWEANKLFQRYDDNSANLFFSDFYCVTDDYNVYKCIDNNNGQPSQVKPTGTGTSIITLGDGYKWKFMYSVTIAQAVKFLTNDWLPVLTLEADNGTDQWTVQQTTIAGGLHAIEVTNGGDGYTGTPAIGIIGDGVGATATPVMSGGAISHIIVNNPGTGYNYAEIVFTGGAPTTPATARPIYAPLPRGHGFDAIEELGGFYVMVNAELEQDELDNLPISNDFRNIGLLADPIDPFTLLPSSISAFNQCTRMTMSSITGTFDPDVVVTGLLSGATGNVVQWNSTTNNIDVNNIIGAFVAGEGITCSSGSGVVDSVTAAELQPYTGKLVMMENRSPISRAEDQTEQIRVIFEF